jgi:hypothetical protein
MHLLLLLLLGRLAMRESRIAARPASRKEGRQPSEAPYE